MRTPELPVIINYHADNVVELASSSVAPDVVLVAVAVVAISIVISFFVFSRLAGDLNVTDERVLRRAKKVRKRIEWVGLVVVVWLVFSYSSRLARFARSPCAARPQRVFYWRPSSGKAAGSR